MSIQVEEITSAITNNLETVGVGVGGVTATWLFIKSTFFRSKKMDTDTDALSAYGTIIKQLRDELTQTTNQLHQVIQQNNETLQKLNLVIKENSEFKAKIEQLENEKYKLFQDLNDCKKNSGEDNQKPAKRFNLWDICSKL